MNVRVLARHPSQPDSGSEPFVEPPSAVRATRTGYTRVRYTVESRLAELTLAPASANTVGALAELPDTRAINVYETDVATIAERSRVLCACPACLEPGEDCAVCKGSNRIEAWITVRVSRRFQVTVAGEGEARERHRDVSNPEDFERTEWPNQLVHQAWYRSVPPQLSKALYPKINPRHERVLWVLVQAFIG